MTTSPIRLAVVGAGNQCSNALMPAFAFLPQFELVAVCDLDSARAAQNASRFGAKAYYTDVTALLAKEAPEACLVVGPPQMHEEIGLQCLEAGTHLFIEKPSAPTIAGARRLAEAAERTGRIGQVGHMMRHADPVRVAHDLTCTEEFGEILSVESRYTTWPSPAFSPDTGWGQPDENWSYMLNQGGHPIDLLRHFLGEIRRVCAFRKHGRGATKVYAVIAEGDNERVGYLNLQDSFNGWTTGLEIVGDGRGIVSVDDLGRVTYRRGEVRTQAERSGAAGNTGFVWEPHHTLPAWRRSGYGNQFAHFADCIRAKIQPKPSLRDGWRNLIVARAILDSLESAETITLSTDGAEPGEQEGSA